MTAQTNTPQAEPRYYDIRHRAERMAAAKAWEASQHGATRWLAGETPEQHARRMEAEKVQFFDLFYDNSHVAAMTKRDLAKVAEDAGTRLRNSFPKDLRDKTQLVAPKPETVGKLSHVAHTQMMRFPVRGPDGEKVLIGIMAANYRADFKITTGEDGKRRITPDPDKLIVPRSNVNAEKVYYATAWKLDAQGQPTEPDERFGKAGVAFRLSDLAQVRAACCQLAGVQPSGQPAPHQQQRPTDPQARAALAARMEAQAGRQAAAPSPARRVA